MFAIFVQGGILFMAVLTIILVAMFFAAWKAPCWVKEIGRIALLLSVLSFLLGVFQMLSSLIQVAGMVEADGLFDMIHPVVLFTGIKSALIPLVYGMIIDMISLIIRFVQKPRL